MLPYRDSKLTSLLADSLGGNCKTTLLACLSPAQDFCRESNNTLKFAHSCKKIENVVKRNKFKGSIPAGTLPLDQSAQSTMQKLKQKKMPWDGAASERTSRTLTTKAGQVTVWESGDPAKPAALLLPLSAAHMLHQLPAFHYSGYRTIEIDGCSDMKGF